MSIFVEQLTTPASITSHLRQDTFINSRIIAEIERSFPISPQSVWAAWDEHGGLVGQMNIHTDGDGVYADLRATVNTAEGMAALLGQFGSENLHVVVIRQTQLPELNRYLGVEQLDGANFSLSLCAENWRAVATPGEVRRVNWSDIHGDGEYRRLLETEPVPAPAVWLSDWPEDPDSSGVVYALVVDGLMVSSIGFRQYVDDVWIVAEFYTPETQRGRGYAKAVLSCASRAMLDHGHPILYQVRADNLPSVRAAAAVGYHEVYTSTCVRVQIPADLTERLAWMKA